MKIILTGASGFLGTYIRKEFISEQVITLGRSNADIITDLVETVPILPLADMVIHAAGKAHTTPKSNEDIAAFYNVNVLGTKNLLEGLSKSLTKRFVFISSVSVYGLIDGENISKYCSLLAEDPYGKSKIEAEFTIKKWCEEHDVTCTILRLPLIVGSNPPGNLGQMIKGIKKGYYFNISGGTARKSMVLASDVAKFIIKAAEIGGIYNLSDGSHPNFNELSHSIANQIGRKFVPNMPMFIARILAIIGDIVGSKFPINSNKLNKINSTLTFDDSRAREAFGWNPTPVLKGFKIHE